MMCSQAVDPAAFPPLTCALLLMILPCLMPKLI